MTVKGSDFGIEILCEIIMEYIDWKRVTGLPVIHGLRAGAADGGLMSYGFDLPNVFRQAAVYADRILRGASPIDVPVYRPAKFELVINLATARTLGINVPLSLILRVDEMLD